MILARLKDANGRCHIYVHHRNTETVDVDLEGCPIHEWWESTISCIGSKFAQSPTIIGQPEVIKYTETCKTMLKHVKTVMVQVNKQTSIIRVSCSSDASSEPSDSSSSTPYQLPVRLDHIHLPKKINFHWSHQRLLRKKYMLSPLIFLGGVNAALGYLHATCPHVWNLGDQPSTEPMVNSHPS